MRPAKLVSVSVGSVAAALALLISAAPYSSAAERARTSASPDSTTFIAILTGVAATSARQAWAVGWTDMFSQPSQAVIMRWNAHGWKRIRGLRPQDATLEGVTAVSGNSAWTVGYYARGALVMRFSGGKWRRASIPSTGPGSKLFGVDASSARSAWAVGCTSCLSGGGKPLALRWNGAAWRQVRLPRLGSGSELLGVTEPSAATAFAVGCTRCLTAQNKPVLLRWRRGRWRQVRVPAAVGDLAGVTALSARSAWAVGCASCQFGAGGKSLILRWNGATWKRARTPAIANSQLYSITALSARSAWAVGTGGMIGSGSIYPNTVVLRWNGSTWKRVPSPTSKLNGGQLLGVAATSAKNAWAVGNNFNDEAQTVILHWTGAAWHRA